MSRPATGRSARPACRVPSLGSALNREGSAEAAEGLDGVARGPGFESDDAGVAEPVQGGGDGRVVDLAGAGLAAAGDVGDLDLADEREGALDELEEVSLADLRVVEVQVEAQVGVVDGLDEGECVRSRGEGNAGVIHRRVEVLEREHS